MGSGLASGSALAKGSGLAGSSRWSTKGVGRSCSTRSASAIGKRSGAGKLSSLALVCPCEVDSCELDSSRREARVVVVVVVVARLDASSRPARTSAMRSRPLGRTARDQWSRACSSAGLVGGVSSGADASIVAASGVG